MGRVRMKKRIKFWPRWPPRFPMNIRREDVDWGFVLMTLSRVCSIVACSMLERELHGRRRSREKVKSGREVICCGCRAVKQSRDATWAGFSIVEIERQHGTDRSIAGPMQEIRRKKSSLTVWRAVDPQKRNCTCSRSRRRGETHRLLARYK